uniref:Uncharacterized protein n=1 Tax=Rhizophora mucronata TaxID=61149 RepID=A0A2P2JM57_RHIMU
MSEFGQLHLDLWILHCKLCSLPNALKGFSTMLPAFVPRNVPFVSFRNSSPS